MSEYTCKQKGCPVAEGGSCLEGFAPVSECPHASLGEEKEKPQTESASEEIESEDAIHFHSGEALTYPEGSSVLRKAGGKVIVVVGAQFSGKTTLLSRIYEDFERGKFAGMRFAGSMTLLEFSRRCWLASCGSMRMKPDTERTKDWESDRLLHLQVQNERDELTDLLVADISGESYKTATSSLESFRKLEIIRRADQVVLFLDCKRLMDIKQRSSVESKACAFLRLGFQEGFLGDFTSLTIVLSKWDKVGDPSIQGDNHRYIEGVVRRVQSVARNAGAITVRKIAARPDPDATWISDDDLVSLFSSWFEESPRLGRVSPEYPPTPKNLRRMQTYTLFYD